MVGITSLPVGQRDLRRQEQLEADPLVRYAVLDSLANVLCPACKLWNTGHGANMMREAVSLMGGYGVTEDCPGFLGQKWMDAQLEATYEGPEAGATSAALHHDGQRGVPRSVPPVDWRDEVPRLERPGTGACTIGTAMRLWLWTLEYAQKVTDADGSKLYHKSRQGVTFRLPMRSAVAFRAAVHPRRVRTGNQGSGQSRARGGSSGHGGFLQRSVPRAMRTRGGRGGAICAEIVHVTSVTRPGTKPPATRATWLMN